VEPDFLQELYSVQIVAENLKKLNLNTIYQHIILFNCACAL